MPDIYYAVAHRSAEEIASFKTRYDDFDESVIPEIFKRDLGLTVTKWKRSESWGSSHVIYFVETKERDDELVFRANFGFNEEPEEVMLMEKLVMEAVDGIGVPTNIVLHVNISRKQVNFDYQIQEKLRGDDLEDHFKGSKEDYDLMSYQLGELVAKYHTLEYEGFGMFEGSALKRGKLQGSKKTFSDYIFTSLDYDLENLREFDVLSKKDANEIVRILEEGREVMDIDQGVLVHHDLADHNIMFEGGEITGIFDWEAAVVGDPVLDLASCPTWRTHYPREEQLLAGYQSVSALQDNFEEKKNLYLLRTMLWKTVYATRMDIMTPARKARLTNVLAAFGM